MTNGKGDRNRSLSKKYSINYDEIDWSKGKLEKRLKKAIKQGLFDELTQEALKEYKEGKSLKNLDG